jgi:hypothetical protein
MIELDTSRQGDIAVSLPGMWKDWYGQAPAIREDLWRAFIDWSQGVARYYDTVTKQAVMLPKIPALLEPEQFRELRHRLEVEPDRFIAIEPIPMETQVGWMREFAASRSDVVLRDLLTRALAGDKPEKLFVTVLRNDPQELHLWHQELRRRVREQAWL